MSYLLIGLSVCLLNLSFPNWNISALAWVCLVPLFMACQENESDFRQLGFKFFIFGLLSSLGMLFWIVHVTIAGYLMVSFYFALYWLLFSQIVYRLKRKISFPLAAAFSWVALEYIRGHFLSGFPWGILGSTQYQNLKLIQIVSVTGVYGLSFLLVFVNGAIFELLSSKKEISRLNSYAPLLLGVSLILVTIGYGTIKIDRDKENLKTATLFKLTMIQGNIAPILYWDSDYIKNKFEAYYQLTAKSRIIDSDMIIWPESSIEYEVRYSKVLLGKIKNLCLQFDSYMLLGSDDMQFKQEKEYYNSAFFFSPQGDIVGQYDKMHLVPFGEYIPFKKIFPFFQKFVPIEENFESGKEYKLFSLQKGDRSTMFSVLICFEDVFPDLVRKFVFKGADFLVNITNDGWFKESHQPYQHAALAVFRAVENNVYLIRATNTGLSCLINPYGLIEDKMRDSEGKDIFVDGFLNMNIKVLQNHERTFYTRWGDVFAIFCLLVMGFYLFAPKKIVISH